MKPGMNALQKMLHSSSQPTVVPPPGPTRPEVVDKFGKPKKKKKNPFIMMKGQ